MLRQAILFKHLPKFLKVCTFTKNTKRELLILILYQEKVVITPLTFRSERFYFMKSGTERCYSDHSRLIFQRGERFYSGHSSEKDLQKSKKFR